MIQKNADSRIGDEMSDEPEFTFHVFLQYLFWGQWKSLRSYASGKTRSLFGDLPIYAAPDSSEVWQRPDLFSGCVGLRFFPRGRAARLFQ